MSTQLHDTISPTSTAGTASTTGAGDGASQRRPTTAGLLGAAVIDLTVLIAPPVALHLLRGWTALAAITAVELLALTVIVLACTGWTPGLAAIGARMVTAEGSTTPGLGRAAARVALTLLTPIGSGEAGFVDAATRCRTLLTRRSRRTDSPVREPGPGDARRRAPSKTAHPRTRGSEMAGRRTAMPLVAPSGPSATAPPSPPAVGAGAATAVPGPASTVDSAPVPPPAAPAPEPVDQSAPAAPGGILGPAAPGPRMPSPQADARDPRESQRSMQLAPDAQSASGRAAAPIAPRPAETTAPPGHAAPGTQETPGMVGGRPVREDAAPGTQETPGMVGGRPVREDAAPGTQETPGMVGGRPVREDAAPGAQETPLAPPPPPVEFASPAPLSPASPNPSSTGRRARAGEPDTAAANAPVRRRRRATSHRASASPAAPSSPMSPSEAPPPPAVGQAPTQTTTRETVLGPAGTDAAGSSMRADPRTVPQEAPSTTRQAGQPDFVLVTGSGLRVPVEGQCVIGRAPRPAFPEDTQMVTLDTSSSALSRSHLRIGFDDQQLWAEDLRSANGTVMVHPTGQQIRLRPEWRTAVAPGAVLLLADESITVEKSA